MKEGQVKPVSTVSNESALSHTCLLCVPSLYLMINLCTVPTSVEHPVQDIDMTEIECSFDLAPYHVILAHDFSPP